MTPSLGRVSVPNSFISLFVFYICPTSFQREWVPFLGAWCPLPAFRSCFVEVAQHSNDLLMSLRGRKWSPVLFLCCLRTAPTPIFKIRLLLLFSHSVVSDCLWPHGLMHTRLPCPSQSPRACSNSCPLSWWCHPTIKRHQIIPIKVSRCLHWIYVFISSWIVICRL